MLTCNSHKIQNNILLGAGMLIGLVIFIFAFMLNIYSPVHAKETPKVNANGLHIELVIRGLKLPTALAFLGPDDILVLE